MKSLYSRFTSKGPSGFGYASTAEEVTAGLDLSGKTILITGVTSGLGLETARVLSMRGARIIGLARTAEKAREAMSAMPNAPVPIACDLADLASVRAAVATVQALGMKLDALICNAGIMALPKLEQKHGYELQFFTNHVGHFALVTELIDALADDGRVVMLSSGAHTDVAAAGIEFDNLVGLGFRILGPLVLKTIPQGAATQCYVAVHPDAAGTSGEYFANCNIAQPSAHAQDAQLAAKLWDETETIVAAIA